MKVFSKVYCDRVYFVCAERLVTGSGFEPPAAPPTHLKVECPLPGCNITNASYGWIRL